MMKINFLNIFFLVLFILIYGIDEEDFFDDLWKRLKPSTSKNFKKQKFGEINAIKEEEIEDIKPKELQKIKKEQTLDEQNKNLKIKIKMPKIELEQLSEESFENEFDEEADQDISSTDENNSSDDAIYNDMNTEKINEMEILNKFNLMKTEMRKESVYKNLANFQFEEEIAKKLGTNRKPIYKLKKKLGQKRERTEESEETKRKRKLITKYDQLKKEKIYGFNYDKSKRNKIEHEIANELGINRMKIYKWKKEIGLLKKFSRERKIEKIKQFEKMKEEISKKFNLKPNMEIEIKIATKLGVGWGTIYGWKRKFGFIIRKSKIYSYADKFEYVKRSEEMKKRNPMISERKIAEKLGIPNGNLREWTKKYGTKLNR